MSIELYKYTLLIQRGLKILCFKIISSFYELEIQEE